MRWPTWPRPAPTGRCASPPTAPRLPNEPTAPTGRHPSCPNPSGNGSPRGTAAHPTWSSSSHWTPSPAPAAEVATQTCSPWTTPDICAWPAPTRRANQASRLSAVVVRFSRTRKRYERQGLLVEDAALEQAERQCLSDEAARARRRERDRDRRADADVQFQAQLAAEICRLFPGCPAARAAAIAGHTATPGSGRVGRSAAARALDTDAVTNAVVA